MPNKNGPRETITDAEGKRVSVRSSNRDAAVTLLAGGMSRVLAAKELCINANQIYKWLKEPKFNKELKEQREMIAFDAINKSASLVSDATQTLAVALAEHDNPKLALELLDKMGVLRTTADRIGMDAVKSDAAGAVSVTINLSGNGVTVEPVIKDAESTVISSDILDNGQQ